jgi:hypothetical protein
MTGDVVFRADRGAYLRTNAWLAAAAMAGGMAILWAMGNPHVWTGAVGGLAAIALRAWYVADEEVALSWRLTPTHLEGPALQVEDRAPAWRLALADIAQVRTMGSFVQVITAAGDKHLLKYLADPPGTVARIDAARRARAEVPA